MDDRRTATDPTTMDYVRLADGGDTSPLVVFLPGAMCPPQVIALAAPLIGCRVVGLPWLEARGGHDLRTLARNVLTVTDELGPAVLVGHSVGSAIAILAAAQDSSRERRSVVGLVLSNSGANTKGLRDIDSIVDRVRHEWGPEFWADFVRRCVHRQLSVDAFRELVRYPERLNPEAVVEVLMSQHVTDLLPHLRQLSIPSAVVHGRLDPARTLDHAREMAAALRGCDVAIVDSGHTSCLEVPDVFAAVVREVIARARW
jgi:3-oxoadipate enol-lactonase